MSMMSAAAISRKYNKKGSAVGDLMDPVRGIRDVQRRRGIEPVNHAANNVRALREKQMQNRAKRSEGALASQPNFKMKKFSGVKSRVATDGHGGHKAEAMAEQQRMRTEREEQKKRLQRKADIARLEKKAKVRSRFLWNHPSSSSNLANTCLPRSPPPTQAQEVRAQRGAIASRDETRKPAVPKRGERASATTHRAGKNFIQENRREAVAASPPKKTAEVSQDGINRDGYGTVPLYLQERKAEMAEEAAKRAQEEENRKGPKGMVLMPEDERLDTLRILKENLKTTKDHLARMTLLVETPSAINRKAQLERKLQEIEDAINIFSRQKVYIKED